ncbi:hypothetical protein M3Y98_00899400 [Aphelenchoides besseyi]|nr:hypothetical protein M3Y98_00899400 [Aphelenchoides besseyi]KAI6193640.1 hypothetical protein M3Y96_01040100 [Aphelenchoides besseyi]
MTQLDAANLLSEITWQLILSMFLFVFVAVECSKKKSKYEAPPRIKPRPVIPSARPAPVKVEAKSTVRAPSISNVATALPMAPTVPVLPGANPVAETVSQPPPTAQNKPTDEKKDQKNEKQTSIKSKANEQKSNRKVESKKSIKREVTCKEYESAKPAPKEANEKQSIKKSVVQNNAKLDIKETKADSPPVVKEEFVQNLGNLDAKISAQTAEQRTAELNQMTSVHELEKKPQPPLPPNVKVVIVDQRCKLYETNQEQESDQQDHEEI